MLVEKICLLFFLSFLFFLLIPIDVTAGSGENNVTSLVNFSVGASEPILRSVNVTPIAVDLIPNSTSLVSCVVEIQNDAGDSEILNVNAEFFDNSGAFGYGDFDDNNSHYTNSSCEIDTSFGDSFEALANCTFQIYYYATANEWNCTVNVTNTYFSAFESNTTEINSLLALGLPDFIDYGTVDALSVSDEQVANVTNYGNTPVNLSLSGYAQTEGDLYAMNCSFGSDPFIPIEYEKYNLSDVSNPGILTLSEFENTYVNLSDVSTVREFNLNVRQNENYNEAVNESYWRIYIPMGVAGTCEGNVLVGAVEAPGV